MKSLNHLRNIKELYGVYDILLASLCLTLIMILIDYFNVVTFLIKILGLSIIICIVLLATIKLASLKIVDLFKLKSVNYIDYYAVILLLGLLIYEMFSFIFKSDFTSCQYVHIGIYFVIVACVCVILFRSYYVIYDKNNLSIKLNHNVYDLNQLYNDEIPTDVQFFFMNDEAADYDLLKRDRIINQMTNTIINCNTDKRFIMSLKGEWGSGKTTILNNVKRQLRDNDDIIFIDDFEPWIYTDKKSLLIAFFDAIMKNIHSSFRINEINIFTKVYLNTLTSNISYKLGYKATNLFDNNINIDRIKKIINNYLESNGIRIVLVLDNLERCTSDNILYILNVVHNLFDFKGIIYILSYDELVMKDIFDNKLDMDYSYLEKIVQLEFKVPKIDKGLVKDIIDKCMMNYFGHSKYQLVEKDRKMVVGFITDIIDDLRDLKRIINSTFNASFDNANYLNNIDMFLIEVIALKNEELWKEIFSNSNCYISEDRNAQGNYISNVYEYNVQTTNYFDNLFVEDSMNINTYKDILIYLFPNVKKYINERRHNKDKVIKFISEGQAYSDKYNYGNSILEKRIYNAKFFDLYFMKTNNEFIEIDYVINDFIQLFNSEENLSENILLDQYMNMEKVYPGWVEKYTLETFQIHLSKINSNNLLKLLYIVYKSYYYVDNTPLYVVLNAKRRTPIIIADIIHLLRDEDFLKFINDINNDYKNLHLIHEILYWSNPEKRTNENLSEERYESMHNLYNNMISSIKANNINMYLSDNYNKFNMLLLFEDKDYRPYIKEIINVDNLMLFIVDCMSYSYGTRNFYTFDKETIDELYGWEKAKNDIKMCPGSSLKNFLVQAIVNAKYNEPEKGRFRYEVDEWIDVDKLVLKYLHRI